MTEAEPPRLAGQRVLITGGSSGIGLACAERLGRSGARLALIARGPEALEEACARVRNCAGVFAADATDAEAIGAAVERAAALLGGLDAVVVNAAAAAYGPFAAMATDDYRSTIESALLGPMNTARAALAPLSAGGGGRLVFIGSVAGRVPVPWLTAYAAAKHGVRGFARSLACELRALEMPVSVAVVNPGPVDTPFWERVRTPDRRLPPKLAGVYSPADVAAEVERALASPGRLERTVGGLMAACAFADALAPNLTVRVIGPLARFGWRRRDRRPASGADGIAAPARRPRSRGGLSTRPSVLTRLRTRRLSSSSSGT
ncbi:MAG: SDR family NAD(P)-dependent oxidoreductase [Solirubrobacterales bacterium]|nr:SDR family NAD(P)-dependent oxidoreductase [Solirubrobacterales bacterium]MBV9715322.1 SDR family NAD(P)-dependent oxidoreductase [Solirubrobacterales bacterium]